MTEDKRLLILGSKSGGGGGGDAVWGSIGGTITDQTDLMTELNKKANTSSLSTVATSGSYNDLSDKPSIPAAQVQSDWNQSDNTAVDYIKNKPSMSMETLTFVDANNVSTTVVVYTQPQI